MVSISEFLKLYLKICGIKIKLLKVILNPQHFLKNCSKCAFLIGWHSRLYRHMGEVSLWDTTPFLWRGTIGPAAQRDYLPLTTMYSLGSVQSSLCTLNCGGGLSSFGDSVFRGSKELWDFPLCMNAFLLPRDGRLGSHHNITRHFQLRFVFSNVV